MKPLASTVFVLALSLSCALCGGCATQAPVAPAAGLLHDDLFAASAEPIDAAAIFQLSPEMQRYADTQLAPAAQQRDRRVALLEALFKHNRLHLDYDAGSTRNARQAFDARAGNCLSLVLMTAAFAKYLDLPVTYQRVQTDEMLTRSGTLLLANGHVNLVFGQLRPRNVFAAPHPDDLVVDFLPVDELRGQRSQPLPERTIVAMYFNNRAAEALADGRSADAYAWARAAVLQDAGFATAANTLAVVYLRGGHLHAAEDALRHVLQQEPADTNAIANLVRVLALDGRMAESQALAARLAQIQPVAPFQLFDQGQAAMTSGDYRTALDLFEGELRRQPYQPEVHFWTALAYWRLGDSRHAAQHLSLAMDNSGSRGMHDLYAAKLDHLRASQALRPQ